MSEKIYEASLAEPEDRLQSYADFVAIVKQLRRDCPWDREQTHESVKHLLIEEAYEVVEAIDERDWDELKKELGDILLHVVFHSTIAEQAERFTLQDVIEAETDKLVRRHPHVFGDAVADDAATVLQTWEQTKQQEDTDRPALAGVPQHLPALLRAQRVQEKAVGVGFDFMEAGDAWAKVEEEMAEFRAEVAREAPRASAERVEEELGDVLFALVNYARFVEATPENALQRATDKFMRRFAYVEAQVKAEGRMLADVSLDEMNTHWTAAKAQEASIDDAA